MKTKIMTFIMLCVFFFTLQSFLSSPYYLYKDDNKNKCIKYPSVQGDELRMRMAKLSAAHMKDALYYLEKAKKICVGLPDFEKKEYIYSLIAGTVGMTSGGIREKIVTACQVAATFIIIDYYTQFCEFRTNLIISDYNFEMADFYNDATVHIPLSKSYDSHLEALFWNSIKLIMGMETKAKFYAPGQIQCWLLTCICTLKTTVLNSHETNIFDRPSVLACCNSFESEAPMILSTITDDEVFLSLMFDDITCITKCLRDYQTMIDIFNKKNRPLNWEKK
jgi:hypothetical protein